MDFREYLEGVTKTEAPITPDVTGRLSSKGMGRLLHGAIGIATESGELLDAIKKHVFYSKELDQTNLIEELGDLMWYVTLLSDALCIPMETILSINHNKLQTRYKEGSFTEKDAQIRDLELERDILEQKEKRQ